ncbi:transposase [Tepidiforma sp.]|uniref:REP-associated tyrosine transposase n=1 Tax=Tepidiforma sp. TaxID=2682230 RepID=UPI00261E52E0|nr:transposase [Tepidiforma sp.]MCX7619126.1 transposase [Tepidiforma sp.]
MAFHVTMRIHPALGGVAPPVLAAVWRGVVEQRHRPDAVLLAACLMPDHLHVLARPGERDLIAFVGSLKSWTTRLAWQVGQRGTLWQPGFYDRAVRDRRQFESAARYVIANPVRAGLVESPEAWPFAWAWWFDEP